MVPVFRTVFHNRVYILYNLQFVRRVRTIQKPFVSVQLPCIIHFHNRIHSAPYSCSGSVSALLPSMACPPTLHFLLLWSDRFRGDTTFCYDICLYGNASYTSGSSGIYSDNIQANPLFTFIPDDRYVFQEY